MGQKYSEVPSVDYWVKLVRSADKAGAGDTLPIRQVSRDTNFGRWELDRFAMMQRYRTRSVAWIDRKPGDTPDVVQHGACVRCQAVIGESEASRVVRQVWHATGGRTEYRVCERCRVA